MIEVGEFVSGISPGDLVACAGAGHASHAEIVSVPGNLCVRVPAGVSAQAAALTTIASIALHGMRTAEVAVGDRVAVIGCGLVGQLACRLLRSAGAEVIGVDLDPRRVEAARRGGAHHGLVVGADTPQLISELTSARGVDAVLVTAASTSNTPVGGGEDRAREGNGRDRRRRADRGVARADVSQGAVAARLTLLWPWAV